MNHRWCIYIDILGFSNLWDPPGSPETSEKCKALKALRALMCGIYRIGSKVYPGETERLFVHQMGDGFAIISDFGENSLARPLSIAVVLMRYVAASSGLFAAAAVSEGDNADIKGCYPNEVMNHDSDGVISLGEEGGMMTYSSVMGTAFIRAHRLHRKVPSIPFVIVPSDFGNRVPSGFDVQPVPLEGDQGRSLLSIDWLTAKSDAINQIIKKSELHILYAQNADNIRRSILNYCENYHCGTKKWCCILPKFLPAHFQPH